MEFTIVEIVREVGFIPIVLLLSTAIFAVIWNNAQTPSPHRATNSRGTLAATLAIVISEPFTLIV